MFYVEITEAEGNFQPGYYQVPDMTPMAMGFFENSNRVWHQISEDEVHILDAESVDEWRLLTADERKHFLWVVVQAKPYKNQ